MIYRLLKRVVLISSLAMSAGATSYFVAPTGDDSKSGLSETEAWATIDNGEEDHLLHPGDTINILSGVYTVGSTIDLKTHGTAVAPIVYRGYGGLPTIDAQDHDITIISLSESFIRVEGLELLSTRKHGIRVEGDSCVIAYCYVHDAKENAIQIEGSGNRVVRSLLLRSGRAGVYNLHDAKSTSILGNTIYVANTGIDIQVNENTARIVDNIIASCVQGISGVTGNICAFNLLWDNNAGDFFGGVADSAGGLSLDPLFVDTAAGDFHLDFGSPAIDAGIDIGCAYTGLAPDLGALETGGLDHLAILPLLDTLSSDSTYQFIAIAHDSADNPAPEGILTWSHTFATGSVDSTGLFVPDRAGTGFISVTSNIDGVTAQSGPMYVKAGAPVALEIIPDSLTIQAGDSQLFSVIGLDQHGDTITDVGTLSWNVSGNIGEIDSTGLFVAAHSGSGLITVQDTLGLSAESDTIRVTPGPLANIDVLPSTNVVPTLESHQYSALGYDALANFIADYTDSVSWYTTDIVGNISASGLYTAGLIGSYWVKASYSGIRDSGEVSVTLGGGLDHVRIELFDGTVVDTLGVTTDNDTTQLFARGYTALNNLISDVSVDWSLLGTPSIGELTPNTGPSTVLSLRRLGLIKVVAVHASGLADTTGDITVSSGEPVSLEIIPDTGTLQAGDSLRFEMVSRDADHNITVPQPVTAWDMLGGLGTIAADGLFTAQTTGTGHVVVEAGGLVDTSGTITVIPGPLVSIRVEPDSVRAGIGDTIKFTAIGLDSLGNATDPGVVSWRSLGRVGRIDASGTYIATAPGLGAVSVSNQIAGIVDTTADLRVEELYFSTIPLGNGTIHPDGAEAPVAEFRIDNYFSASKTVTAMAVRDLSTGTGTAEQLAANMVAARLYVDRDDDSLLSVADSLLAETAYGSGEMAFAVQPIEIPADSGLTFIITAVSAMMARDGDTVDVALIPGADIETADLTIVAGPPLSNSLGLTEVNGLVASQVTAVSTGFSTLTVADSLQLCLTLDLPRNGYDADTLRAITLVNAGTSSETDFDSLVIFADDGDGLWGGSSAESSLGSMVFNGESWSRGGLALTLDDPASRLFVAARLNRYPNDGATVALAVPIDGIRVSSGNDGPIDQEVPSPDTLTIEGPQAIIASRVAVSAHPCIPGQSTGPLFAIQMTNGYTQSVAIDSCRFAFLGTDPQGASAAQLASQVDSVYLYLDRDGVPGSISAADSLVTLGRVQSGYADFHVGGLAVAGSGGSCTVVVAAKLSLLKCKNGNSIGFSLADSSAIVFDQAVRLTGSFPLTNPSTFSIDAFPAAAVVVHSLPSGNLYAGQVDQPVLDFEIPRNGYAADRLTSIKVVNSGTLSEHDVLENVRLWKDRTGNGFSTDDAAVGQFGLIGEEWRLSGISTALDSPLNRFVVTTSVSAEQFEGGTLRLDLPPLGVTTTAGTTGPDDVAVANTSSFLIFPSNRVTAISIPTPSAPVYPGSADLGLLTFALYNGYVSQPKTLTQLTLTNSTRSAGSTDFADHELGQVSLFWDTNRNRILDNDQLIGTGLFSNGTLRFEGFTATLPPESLAYFFVISDLPLDPIDGDTLSTTIAKATNFSFSEIVNLNGDLPLSSRGELVVDGSIRRQYAIYGPTGRSLAPGDTNVVLLSFSPAFNGDRPDWLHNIYVSNLGTANNTTIAELSLWHDVNTNHQLDAGDSMLGSFAYGAGTWSLSDLGLFVSSTPPQLFIAGDIAISAEPNATIRLEIPQAGCDFESDNDGPIDSSILAPGTFTVSTSGLKVSLGPMRETYSVGQSIEVPLTVTNLTGSPIDSVFASLVEIENPSLVRLDSSSNGPVNLASGESITRHFYFTATGEGRESWSFQAVSRAPVDSSILIQTLPSCIQRAISPVTPRLLNTSPTAVTKGQSYIFPMTLECAHPDTSTAVAAMEIQYLRFRVADGQGAAVPANSVFSRMMIAAGYEILSVLTTVPTESAVQLAFSHPVSIGPSGVQTLLLIVDIVPSTVAPDFSISVDSASWIPLLDANTGQTVPNAQSVTYPMRTASTRIDEPSQQIAVSAASCTLPTINNGQQDANILKLLVRHGGESGSSAVQLTEVSLEVTDSIGNGLPAGDLFSKLTVWRHNYLIGEVTLAFQDSSNIDIPLSTPVNLSAQEIDSIVVAVSVRPSVPAAGFQLRIADSSLFTVRDLNTGSALLAVSDTTLASGNVFPIVSNWSAFRLPAEPVSICLDDIAPSSIAGGAGAVPLVSLGVTYPTLPQHSAVRLSRLNLKIEDGSGGGIDPDQLFDKMGVSVNGGAIRDCEIVPAPGGAMDLTLADSGLVLSAGDSLQIDLVGDFRLEAPYGSFALHIVGLTDFSINDMSDPSRTVGANAAAGCVATFPFTTGTTSILLPAGRPIAVRTVRPVQMAPAGTHKVTIFEGTLAYQSSSPLGQIEIRGMTAALSRRVSTGSAAGPISASVAAFHMEIGGAEIGTDTMMTGDTLAIIASTPVTMSRGESVPIRVTCDLSGDAEPGNIVLTFLDSSFITVVDKSLQTPVYPVLSGTTYPVAAGEISIVAAELETSFTNYPNPFNPGRGEVTTIGFVLTENAMVDIDIFSITGDAVSRISNQSFRPAGAYQSDTWNGMNGDGRTVVPGVYFCRIIATYDSGRTETFRRKVAVVR